MKIKKSIFSAMDKKFRRLWLPGLLITCCTVGQADAIKPVITENALRYTPDEIGQPHEGTLEEKPSIQKLGGEKYRIGSIQIDKANRLMTVPGTMLPYEEGKAIEFIATMTQGYKAYESVLTLDVNAFEFNLACILIGLESNQSKRPKYHFDPQILEGDPVSLKVSWMKNGKWVEHDVVELLKFGDKKPATPSKWSYTGSMFIEGERYLAQMDGVLIGLSHDPASIIEHREGLGIGQWGSIVVDSSTAPLNGQKVMLTVQNLK